MAESPFRQYDIRGIVGEAITPDLARSVGRALGSLLLQGARVALGRDCRHSSAELQGQLAAGLCEAGCDVLDVGMVPTPALYFAAMRYASGCGVMVTGSHNPSNHNGFKPLLGGINPPAEVLQVLRRRCDAGIRPALHRGSVREFSVEADYLRSAAAALRPIRHPLHVVIDAGNGAAGDMAVKFFERIGCLVTPLFCDPDGDFPNHHPDPVVPDNLIHLRRTVREQGADLGLAYDTDGDRLGVVASDGRIVPCDRVLALLMSALLIDHPGAACVYDVKCSDALPQTVERLGGIAHLSRTGHTLVKARMRGTGALLAGEFSGHICFADRWCGMDDALYAGARLIEGIDSGLDMDGVLAQLPVRVGTPELYVPVGDVDKFAMVEALQCNPSWLGAPERIIGIDGVRAEWPDGWGLIRASNTTPALTLRLEGHTEAALEGIYNRLSFALQQVGAQPPPLEILTEDPLD
ncbi:MAG: phosphomannomutase/phosphoglucomutase [Gammaproteobacteria bacterium AqS3]|nr:phosphomannomutase/phosphoglucomutase [Gammaproteobacteria bacterium AqS3]